MECIPLDDVTLQCRLEKTLDILCIGCFSYLPEYKYVSTISMAVITSVYITLAPVWHWSCYRKWLTQSVMLYSQAKPFLC